MPPQNPTYPGKEGPAANKAGLVERAIRRLKAIVRYSLRWLHQMRAALAFSALLAGVALALFTPLLLDDLAFRASYLLRPSQDAISITEPVVVSEQPRIAILSGTLSVPPALTGRARTGEALAALLKGGSARLALKAPTIQIDLTPQGLAADGQAEDGAAGEAGHNDNSPLVTAIEDGTFEMLSMRDATISLRADDGRTYTLTDFDADIQVKRKAAVRIKASFKFNGETITVDATFGSRIGRSGMARVPVRVHVTSALFTAAADGRLDLAPHLRLAAPVAEITIGNVRSLARWLGQSWPGGPGLRDVTVRGAIDWSGPTLNLQKGTIEFDGSEGNGALSLSLAGPRPAISGTLAFPTLDLSAYLPSTTAYDAGPGPNLPRSLVARLKASRDVTLPLAGLVDADLRLSAERVNAGGLTLGQGAASLSLKAGQLMLTVAELALTDGSRAEGELSVGGPGFEPDFSLRARVMDGDISAAALWLTGLPVLRGRGELVIEASGRGATGKDVLSRLGGRIELDMPSGGFAYCTIAEVHGQAAAGVADGCRFYTELDPLKAKLESRNGIVTFDRVQATSGGDLLMLDGRIDLVTSVMGLTVSATPQARPVSVAGEPTQATPAVRDAISIKGRPEELVITVAKKAAP